ncbi:hypothetical protein ACVR1G_08350 [Streptococcus dentasini]
MCWIILNYETGDYVRENGAIKTFDSLGLAHQYLERFRLKLPEAVTKKVSEYDEEKICYYNAPFKFFRAS